MNRFYKIVSIFSCFNYIYYSFFLLVKIFFLLICNKIYIEELMIIYFLIILFNPQNKINAILLYHYYIIFSNLYNYIFYY